MKSLLGRWFRRLMRDAYRRTAPMLVEELERCRSARLREKLRVENKEFFAQMPVTVTGDVRVGNRVSMAAYVHIWGDGGVTIGDRVMIGSHTAIVSSTHDIAAIEMWQTEQTASVVIGDNVWIGAHCVILPGVMIGRGSVIGAGSVVTRSVPENCVVTGVPAAVRRTRIADTTNTTAQAETK